jgi:hypothetical protein
MHDYQPLELGQWCNVGGEFAGSQIQALIGLQTFHGLPFLIGSATPDHARCFIGFNGEGASPQPLSVPLGLTAHNLVFAHTLLETRADDGEAPGRVIAHYIFQYADGERVRVPIRERFEINIVPTGWGKWPFLALPDQKDALMPRDHGHFGAIGRRQAEAMQGTPRAYYLWAWRNPHPERAIAALQIEPADRKFLIAAITSGHVDESPFPQLARSEVKIVLPDSEDAARPFDLAVDVDRGTATFPFALPARDADAFLADDMKGWGEAQNGQSSPAYVEISAAPSATVRVSSGDELLGSTSWGELQERGRVDLPRARLEMVDHGRNWVKTSVLDDATGQPVACRVHFRSPEGVPYQPHGHHNFVNANLETWHSDVGGDLRLGQITYAYINGECEGWLPRGDVIVDVARGFEYEPLRARVQIAPGQRTLTLRLKRVVDMNARRWFSGDTHVHFLGAQGAHFEAQGEDLNVVNLLASQWGHLFTNTEDFIGGPTSSNSGNTIVYCSQENRQHMLGHLSLLGLKKPVYPWCSDGPSEAELGGALEETLSYWADATHAQGGTVVIPHLPTPNCEPAVLIATGRADAVEMIRFGAFEHLEYYRYLNCGYRLPVVGGTDKMSSEVPVGLYRTYAYVPTDEAFDYDNWCKALRAGRTVLSGGPLLEFTVDGRRVGDTCQLPRGGGTVEVHALAESIFPMHTLEIVQDGRVVAATTEARGARRLELKAALSVRAHTWLAARCGGPGYTARPHHDVWRRGAFAHTSPVYVAVGEPWWMFDKDAAQYMLTLIEGGLSHIRQRALYYPRGSVTHHHGGDDHQAYLEKPFHEAAQAIHQRLHQLGIAH